MSAARLLPFLLMIFALPNFGTTLVSTTGYSGVSTFLNFPNNEEIIGVSWSQAVSSYGTDISAQLFGSNGSGGAYLMYAPGPGTAPEAYSNTTEQVAITPFVFSNGFSNSQPVPLISIFTKLNLNPGTYYLILSAAKLPDSGPVSWAEGIGPTVTTAPGFHLGRDIFALCPCADYPPASSFLQNTQIYHPLFTVDGTITPVPEPSSVSLWAICLGVLAMLVPPTSVPNQKFVSSRSTSP